MILVLIGLFLIVGFILPHPPEDKVCISWYWTYTAMPYRTAPQVGVLTMAGRGPELLVSPTDDMGKILSSLHGVSIHGKTNFSAAIKIAQVHLAFVHVELYRSLSKISKISRTT